MQAYHQKAKSQLETLFDCNGRWYSIFRKKLPFPHFLNVMCGMKITLGGYEKFGIVHSQGLYIVKDDSCKSV